MTCEPKNADEIETELQSIQTHEENVCHIECFTNLKIREL